MKKNISCLWIMLFCIMLNAGIKSESSFDLLYAVDDAVINCSNFYGTISKDFSKIGLFLEVGASILNAENLAFVTPEVDIFLDSGAIFAGNFDLGIECRENKFLRLVSLQAGMVSSENCNGSLFLIKLKPCFSLVDIGCELVFKGNFGIHAELIAGNFGAEDFFSKKIVNGDNWNVLFLMGKEFLFGKNVLSVKAGIFTGECTVNGNLRIIDAFFYREKYGFDGLEKHFLILSELSYRRFCRIGMINFDVSLLYLPKLECNFFYQKEKRFLGKDECQKGKARINFNNSFVCLPEVGYEKEFGVTNGTIAIMLKKTACIPFGEAFLGNCNEKEIAALLLSGFTIGVKLNVD